MRFSRLWVLPTILLAAAYPGRTQTVNGTILGTVTDISGASIPSAKVTIAEVNTGASRNGQTNDNGNYSFPDLPSGRYTVRVDAAGFRPEARKDVDLIINSSTRIDFQLHPGEITSTIEVNAAPALLQTDRSDTGAKVETVLTESLPIGGQRNFQNVLNLAPGTTRASFQHSQFFNAASSLQTEVNGQMRQGNSYQIEGIDNNERTGLLQMLIPPIEAIETVDISTSNFEAELGRATGAVTNVQLKSGTNAVHGAAYEFMKNSYLNARNFFDPSVGHLAYNYFGGNVGGPIRKNKIFFFGDFLRITDHEANTNLGTIPSMAFRGGDLSAAPTTIYDPATGNADGTGRAPFSNNVIPASRINPVSGKMLGLIPSPNQSFKESAPSNNYFGLLPFTKDTNSLDGKVDANLSDNNRLSGRFSFSRPVVFQAPIFGAAGGWGPTSNKGFQGTGIQKTYSTGINYTRIVSPTLIGEFRVGVAHYHNEALPTDYGSADATNLGIPGINIDSFTSGYPQISLDTGFDDPMIGYVNSLPWIRAEANIDVVNVWTKTLGNHTIKWGGDLRRLRDDLLQAQNFGPRGRYRFGEAQTSIPGAKMGFGNDFASFLLDQPYLVGRDLATYFPTYRATQFFAFVQDKWMVTPKLTVDAGLRWEFYPPATPRFAGTFSNYDYVNDQLVLAGIGNNPMNLGMATHYKYFAPRTGLAYRLSQSTVIRSGFGISFTPFPDNKYAWDNFPVKQNNQYNAAGAGYGPAVFGNGQPATFQAGFPTPTPAVIPSNGIITNPDRSQQYAVIPLDYKNGYVESWNLSIQKSLPRNFTLDVAYVGNHGVRASHSQTNLNAGLILGAGTRGQPEYPRTANTILYFQQFSSNYHALQVKLNRRFHNGLAITTSYTWARGMSFQPNDDDGILFYINQHRNYAANNFNRTQTFNQSYVYDLPFGKNKAWLNSGPASIILGGWQVNGVLTLMTGTPWEARYANTGLQAPNNTQTADQVAPIEILHGVGNGNPWISTSSFAAPATATFGNIGRTSLPGPGFFNLDFSVFRNFAITERFKLQLRGEAFGATNTAHFSNPNNTLGSSNFGWVTSTLGNDGGGRVMQLGVKVSF